VARSELAGEMHVAIDEAGQHEFVFESMTCAPSGGEMKPSDSGSESCRLCQDALRTLWPLRCVGKKRPGVEYGLS